jgi:NDP-sugar pyrophosphorylase family protein
LAVGYQRDVIRLHFGDRAFGLYLEYSAEAHPLGTGGALRNAIKFIESDTCFIMNGDSYTDADLDTFVVEHFKARSDMSLIIVPADGREDCGSVLADEEGKVVRFEEKEMPVGSRYLNAGIYMLARRLLYEIPPGAAISLEKDVLPRWLVEGKNIRVYHAPVSCIDIGTPERYRSAESILANVELEDNAPGRESHF